MYVFALNLLCIAVTAISMSIIAMNAKIGNAVLNYLLEIIVGIFAGAMLFPILRLLIYHFEMIQKGLTTN